MGTPDISITQLVQLIAAHDVNAIVTQPERPVRPRRFMIRVSVITVSMNDDIPL
ncbi:hypothetical protein JMUB7504_27560 [Staphylococcus aureus]